MNRRSTSLYQKMAQLILLMGAATATSTSYAIAFGEPDNYRHPNVASLRFIFNNLDARISCTGTLMYKDADKYVFLTAAHCSQPELEGWNSVPTTDGSIGVSLDEINLPDDTDPTDGGADGVNHVSGGISIEHPLYRFPGQQGWNDVYDIALVIIPTTATNSLGQTIAARWGDVPVMPLAPLNFGVQFLANNPKSANLIGVGDGTQSTKTPQGSGTGNKVKIDEDGSFPNRNLVYLSFKNANGAMYNVDTNMTKSTNTGYLCPGDSGSALLLKQNSGSEIALGVLTAGNCRSTGGYSRIDLPEAVKFLSCAKTPGDAAAVKACVASKFQN